MSWEFPPADPWDAYHYYYRQWCRLGRPKGLEPLRPIQRGTHIDSLPVERNPRGGSGALVPTIVPDEDEIPMSRLIDRFHHIDAWMEKAPISLIVLGTFVGTICLMTLMVLAIGVIMR